MNRFLILTALAAAALLLSSCIDSREEIWLNPSGSGKARITLSVPSSAIILRGGPDAVSSSIDEILAKHPSIVSVDKNIITQDNRSTIDVTFRFNSALDLSASMAKAMEDPKIPAPARYFMGKTSFRQDGLTFTGERLIDAGKAVPGSRFLPPADANFRLQTILHLPFTPSEHNATRTANNGRTLIWDIPLATALRSPHIQRIQVRATTPLILAIATTSALILIISLLLWRRRIRSRKINIAPPMP